MGGHICNLKCYYLDLAEFEELVPQLGIKEAQSDEATLNDWKINIKESPVHGATHGDTRLEYGDIENLKQ